MEDIKFDKFEEQVFLNTVRIENLDDGELGTGFLIQVRVGSDKVRHLLFSNKHVFWGKKDYRSKKYLDKDSQKTIQITVHQKNSDGSYSLGDIRTFKFKLERSGAGYFEDGTHEIDVACVNISDVYKQELNMKSIGLEKFNDYSLDQVHASEKIVFVGYPTNFYDRKNSFPVLRSGFVASIPSIDFDGLPQILLDAQVFPGSSGSPVFVGVHGHWKLLGIISSAPLSPVEFIEIPAEHVADDRQKKDSIPVQRIGLGRIFKISAINEICERVSNIPSD